MYLSLCLIAKNENSYMQEWLDYHILLGVEHFWIYDNESTIPLVDTLSFYIDQGWVTVNTIKGRAMQMFAYDHCIQSYGSYSKWIGFIDTDEFIVPHSTEPLSEFLTQFEMYGGLAVSSLFFGQGGNKTRPIGGHITGYRKRTPERFSKNRLVKMIIQPEKVIYPISPHSFLFKENFYCVNENIMRVDAQEFPCHINSIQINHYFTRSEQEWEEKMSRGGGAGIAYTDDRRLKVNKYASVEDNTILNRLKTVLNDAQKESTSWSKIFDRDSPQLIDLLHQITNNTEPPKQKHFKSVEVFARPELKAYFHEMEIGLRIFEKGRLNEAQDFWAAQIKKFPFDPIRYTNFADVCIQLKDFPVAWSALAQAWRIAPKSLYVLLCMTDYFYTIGNYIQAEKTCQMAASQGELQPEGLAIQALSQWKQGKKEEAKVTAQPLLAQLTKNDINNPLFKELINLISQTH